MDLKISCGWHSQCQQPWDSMPGPHRCLRRALGSSAGTSGPQKEVEGGRETTSRPQWDLLVLTSSSSRKAGVENRAQACRASDDTGSRPQILHVCCATGGSFLTATRLRLTTQPESGDSADEDSESRRHEMTCLFGRMATGGRAGFSSELCGSRTPAYETAVRGLWSASLGHTVALPCDPGPVPEPLWVSASAHVRGEGNNQ